MISRSASRTANVGGGFAGSSEDWETAFEGLSSSLADLPDCRIPVKMLQAAVRYTKTSDKKRLLRLPPEPRQLLEDVLPTVSAVASRSRRFPICRPAGDGM